MVKIITRIEGENPILSEKENQEKLKSLYVNTEKFKEDWIKLETIVQTISSLFLGSIDIDEAINASLRDMGVLSGASHSWIYLFNENKSLMSITYEWSADGVDSQKKLIQDLKTECIPWWMEQLSKGKIINIPDISSLPKEAIGMREILIIQNIKSILIFPLYVRNELKGFIGFDNINEPYRWKEIDLSLLRISSQIIGNALERHRIEGLMKESEEKHRLIIENINDLIFILNLKFRFEFINEESVYKLLGYQKEEIIGKNCIDFLHRDDVEKIVRVLREDHELDEPKIELRFHHKEGYWRWFECKGQSFMDKDQKIKWIIISRDITERKIVEERYKDLFENSPNAILLINFKGVIIDANKTVENTFGYSKEFFIKKSINELTEIFHLKLSHYFKQIFQASFIKNFPDPIEIKIITKSNDDLWIKTQASVIKQEGKTFIQLIFEDITERKRAEILEEKFKEELEIQVQDRTKKLNESFEQQKLYMDQIVKSSQFKTEFMATMSHELRTPLNAIIGFTDLLIEGVYGELNSEQKEFITDIKSSAEHQFDMIKHILDISKIESGQISLNLQEFSLNNMIEQIKSSLKPLYSKKELKIKIKGLEEEKLIYADPIRFKEIIYNMLSNAIKFTLEGKITLTVKEKYNEWIFKVYDTGIGIERKDFPLIFKEFKRVDSTYVRSVPGTGLGLSLVKRLVELHGGEISFTSILGTGSTFTFSLSKKLAERNY
jgi:PAS domain S-box-containing protein